MDVVGIVQAIGWVFTALGGAAQLASQAQKPPVTVVSTPQDVSPAIGLGAVGPSPGPIGGLTGLDLPD